MNDWCFIVFGNQTKSNICFGESSIFEPMKQNGTVSSRVSWISLPDIFDTFAESQVKEDEWNSQCLDLKTEFPETTCLSCNVKIVLSNKSFVIERLSEFNYWSYVKIRLCLIGKILLWVWLCLIYPGCQRVFFVAKLRLWFLPVCSLARTTEVLLFLILRLVLYRFSHRCTWGADRQSITKTNRSCKKECEEVFGFKTAWKWGL